MRLAFKAISKDTWQADAGIFRFLIKYENHIGYSVAAGNTFIEKWVWLAGGGKPWAKSRKQAEDLCYAFLTLANKEQK